MKIAFVIYPGMTALDLVGFYDPVTRLKSMNFLPELTWEICSYDPQVADGNGLGFVPTLVGGSLADFDLIFFPGGVRVLVERQLARPGFLEWIQTAGSVPWRCSVCTGALILGAAGFLQGRQATTHRMAYEALESFGAKLHLARVVEDQGVITAGGVTASIDLGLYVCRKLAGDEVARQIAERMEYTEPGS